MHNRPNGIAAIRSGEPQANREAETAPERQSMVQRVILHARALCATGDHDSRIVHRAMTTTLDKFLREGFEPRELAPLNAYLTEIR